MTIQQAAEKAKKTKDPVLARKVLTSITAGKNVPLEQYDEDDLKVIRDYIHKASYYLQYAATRIGKTDRKLGDVCEKLDDVLHKRVEQFFNPDRD